MNYSLKDDLLYLITPQQHQQEELTSLLRSHPEIKFVSLMGVDLGGNDTDEKIPISCFLQDIGEFLSGGVQTDGSSVVLPGIATLNNGKVDLVADHEVNWFIDYNYEYEDECTGKPVGTLKIPSFLIHNGKRVDSRSITRNTMDYVRETLVSLMKEFPFAAHELGFEADDVQEIVFTSATELEFWVKTPDDKADIEELSASQVLQEQYWKRTKGSVRTALERSLVLLEKYGLKPEMGHKEVGGVKAHVSGGGQLNHIMEQLEIDWKYSESLQAADNELLARILIKETFRLHGLEVTFMAKPMEGVAGSGEHTHIGIAARLKNGSLCNLFAPLDIRKDYMSIFGWGAIMGVLKNYEVVNPFITATNDAFNRLKLGFEAPICIVGSVGHSVESPSRNRTVLAGLVRDLDNPMATRFEVRSPNPHTNTYLAISAIYLSALDGIRAAVASGKNSKELEAEFSKDASQEGFYLEKGRAYRSEEDVFEHYPEEERNRIFGVPPATVWENLSALQKYPEKVEVLKPVMDERMIVSYSSAMLTRWVTELKDRIIPENLELVRSCSRMHGDNACDRDENTWTHINSLRRALVQDTLSYKGIFTRIREAIDNGDLEAVSKLQLDMAREASRLKALYSDYKRNLIDFGI